jgi:hypothetical protein
MPPSEVQAYISVISMLAAVGLDVVGKAKQLIQTFTPDHTLTEEQINAIEQAGIAEDQRRRAERIAMGQPS